MPGKLERHARSKWEWGLPGSRSAEVRTAAADDPEPAKRPPGRKDTRAWCRGKPGVEHVRRLVLHPSPFKRGKLDCGWAPSWRTPDGEYGACWSCDHREECARCGKILRDGILRSECPAYPGTPGQRAAAEEKAAEIRERIAQRRPWRRKPVITGPQGYRRKRQA